MTHGKEDERQWYTFPKSNVVLFLKPRRESILLLAEDRRVQDGANNCNSSAVTGQSTRLGFHSM